MTPAELRAAIETLWPGHGGQTRAAEAFQISDRRIRGYLAGKPAVPEWLAAEITDLLETHPDGIRNVDVPRSISVLQSQLAASRLSEKEAAASILGAALAHARKVLGPDTVAELLNDD